MIRYANVLCNGICVIMLRHLQILRFRVWSDPELLGLRLVVVGSFFSYIQHISYLVVADMTVDIVLL